MRRLLLTPSQAGYSVAVGRRDLSVSLSGGPSRHRRDFLGAPDQVTAQWTLALADLGYLQAFYRLATTDLQPFLIELIIDDPIPGDYTATFVPDSWRVSGVAGVTVTVSAQLEVLARPDRSDYDALLVAFYELTGGAPMASYFNPLDRLANEELPRTDAR